jgi:organic radical activating enzyme
MNSANINEIFHSFQGEGFLAGKPFLFIRFGGCNLKCEFCDTKKSTKKTKNCLVKTDSKKFKIPNPVSIKQLAEAIKSFDFSIVSFTGGEPLMYADFIEKALPIFKGKKTFVETNGTLYNSISKKLVREIDYWSVDIKLKSTSKLDLFNDHKLFLKKLTEGNNIMIKCVFSSRSKAEEIRDAYNIALEIHSANPNTTLTFQPMTSKNKIKTGLNTGYIKSLSEEGRLDLRLIPQMHKILGIE